MSYLFHFFSCSSWKIADFCLSKIANCLSKSINQISQKGLRGTSSYLCYSKSYELYSKASDVYAFANHKIIKVIRKVTHGQHREIKSDVPTFAQIVYEIINRKEFIYNLIDQSEFYGYVDLIDDFKCSFNEKKNQLWHYNEFMEKYHWTKKED